MTTELPLFPLNVVLFPDMRLPLHIFEPRYRLMISRCLENDQTFGVCLIADGEEGLSGTIPVNVGCSAEITEVTNHPDGRYNLEAVGRRRFIIQAAREQDDYLVGSVQWLRDERDSTAEPEGLRGLIRSYLSHLAQRANLPAGAADEVVIPADSFDLSMWIPALVSLTNPQKQELLEMTSTEERLKLEYSLLQRAEVIRLAYQRRQIDEQPRTDENSGFLTRFVSPN